LKSSDFQSYGQKLIEKITVFADRFTVKFKSGLAIDTEA
jgi:hypothetical protein